MESGRWYYLVEGDCRTCNFSRALRDYTLRAAICRKFLRKVLEELELRTDLLRLQLLGNPIPIESNAYYFTRADVVEIMDVFEMEPSTSFLEQINNVLKLMTFREARLTKAWRDILLLHEQ